MKNLSKLKIPDDSRVREAMEWADSAMVNEDMVPFNVTRMERGYAKVLAQALRSAQAELVAEREKRKELEAVKLGDGWINEEITERLIKAESALKDFGASGEVTPAKED